MRLVDKVLVSILTVFLASTAFGATITGNVKGPDGKPFMGAFVAAENTQNKMTVTVLSDAQGRYHGFDMTAIFNFVSQCPALSVPSGFTADGLPTGLQIVGRRFDDSTVLRIGAALESLLSWNGRRPPI